jgi:hypothetical protein
MNKNVIVYDWNTTWLEEHDARVAAEAKLEIANRTIENLRQLLKEDAGSKEEEK